MSSRAADQGSISSLNPRERQVPHLIAEGSNSKTAASILGVTKKTADHHRQSLMQELGLHSVAELFAVVSKHLGDLEAVAEALRAAAARLASPED